MDFVSFVDDNKLTAESSAISKGMLKKSQERAENIIISAIEMMATEDYKIIIINE